jgi:hypothetical protein
MVKILKTVESVEPSMMDILREDQRVGSTARVSAPTSVPIHDGDTKFRQEFWETLATGGVKCLRLPPGSPNLSAFAERWVRSG